MFRKKSFWELRYSFHYPWTVRKLLKVRPIISTLVRLTPGIYSNNLFWYAPWTPYGQLLDYLGVSGPSQLGIPRSAKITDYYVSGEWRLPPTRSESQLRVIEFITSVTLQSNQDSYTWLDLSLALSCHFNSSCVWDKIRSKGEVFTHHSIVWLHQSIPRCSTLAWLFYFNRCPTRDRLSNWGLNVPTTCVLCNSALENRDHLLFSCQFSTLIWSAMLHKLQLYDAAPQPPTWIPTVHFVSSFSRNHPMRVLVILAWQVTISEIWKERNSRLHNRSFSPPNLILPKLDRLMRNRLFSLSTVVDVKTTKLLQLWFRGPPLL